MQDGTSNRAVSPERSGWRDESISQRHRAWGFNCPCVDMDFLVVEYNCGKPVALIEYKLHSARPVDPRHPTYTALRYLADKHSDGALPFMIARYWPDIWAMRVLPMNDAAAQWFAPRETVSELEFVKRLYEMRRLTLDRNVISTLNDILPASEAA